MKKLKLPVHKLEHIPDGHVPLSSYGCHSQTRPATAEYAVLASAWKKNKLSGYKLMASLEDSGGTVYVNKEEADEILRNDSLEDARAVLAAGEVLGSVVSPSDEKPPGESDGVTADRVSRLAVVALSGMNNSMSELLDVMTRLAKACEGMASAWGAKQAKEDEKTQAEVSGNGVSVFDN